MGPCVAGGAYLPALSDVIYMVEGTSFMGLGGANLVKGATGQDVDGEELGGARTHTVTSHVAHYRPADEDQCIAEIRTYIERLPEATRDLQFRPAGNYKPGRPESDLYELLPKNHRMAYDMCQVLACVLDDGRLDQFQPEVAAEMLCGHGTIEGYQVAVIANQRGIIKAADGGQPRFGGIVYTESAEKVAYFIETASRQGIPILFVQDVSGFMVGPEAEHSGIIRSGARFVEAMATAIVPKIVLTVNHASGAGYYAMAGQGFDPDFILSWPTGRMAVMEGESAVAAVLGDKVDDPESEDAARQMREDYEHQLDAKFAAARGYVDAIVTPEETREALALTLRTAMHYDGPHLGAFVLPPMDIMQR
jgi:acetyl-CoA carboxylase carboxyltransferase component